MNLVTISPKFQVVIPKEIRESMSLKAGAKLYVLEYGQRIEFVPMHLMKEMRGFLKGIDTTIKRESDRT